MDHSTNKPLAGVHVRLMTGDFGSNGGVTEVYGAMSDTAGRFAMQSVKPGLYLVLGERTGYLQTAAPNAALAFGTVTLKAGQQVTDLAVEMTPQAVIAGRVVDEYGDPLENLQVAVSAVPPGRLAETLNGHMTANTNDHGEFRLMTAPGRYYVQATSFNRSAGPAEIRTDGSSAAPWVSTYYPSSATTGGAAVVTLAAGQEFAGVEIHMMRSTAGPAGRGMTVSGVVTGGGESGGANVMLRFGDAADRLFNVRSASVGADGKFLFGGMTPGYYSATATIGTGKTLLQSRTVTFQLGASDEAGLQLILAPGEEVGGVLALVGNAPPTAGEKRTVRLETADNFNFLGQVLSAEVAKDGQFHIANVPPGRYKASVEPMPENAYVQSVVVDGKAAAGGVLDFSQGAGGSRLKITVSLQGARIAGRLLTATGEVSGSLVMVWLTNDPKNMPDSAAKRATDGTYEFTAVRPGKYRLVALDVLQLVSVMAGGEDSEMIQKFFDAAGEIEIKEGERITKDVTVATKMPEKK